MSGGWLVAVMVGLVGFGGGLVLAAWGGPRARWAAWAAAVGAGLLLLALAQVGAPAVPLRYPR